MFADRTIRSAADMEKMFYNMAAMMRKASPFDRGEVHAQKITAPHMHTKEFLHVSQIFEVPTTVDKWAGIIKPNLPWAEDHFAERVGGEPLNPPPEHENWPFKQKGNEEHLIEGKFSHTYPERFWPKYAGGCGLNTGVRFQYGDLDNLINILVKNPRSRQAYLPVWFPEDLQAADKGMRVPCTLGYHFIMRPNFKLDCVYSMRSCDMLRFYRDDIYMAGRLLQWVSSRLMQFDMLPGNLHVNIDNLHTFAGDDITLKNICWDYEEKQEMSWGAGV